MKLKKLVIGIKNPEVEIFDSEGNSQGWFDKYQFLYARIQIAEQRLEGFYYTVENHRVELTPDGKSEGLPKYIELFDSDVTLNLTCKLREIQLKNEK